VFRCYNIYVFIYVFMYVFVFGTIVFSLNCKWNLIVEMMG